MCDPDEEARRAVEASFPLEDQLKGYRELVPMDELNRRFASSIGMAPEMASLLKLMERQNELLEQIARNGNGEVRVR